MTDVALILVTPRPATIDWLRAEASRHGLDGSDDTVVAALATKMLDAASEHLTLECAATPRNYGPPHLG